MKSSIETWRPAPGYEGSYEISDHGNARSVDRIVETKNGRRVRCRGCALTPSTNRHGHLLYRMGRRGRMYAHRLVALAFIGEPAPGQEVCHNDGNPANNHVSNLRWGTRSENMLDEVESGRHWQTKKTHCKQGHEFTPENTIMRSTMGRSAQRVCRTCNRKWQNAYWARKNGK